MLKFNYTSNVIHKYKSAINFENQNDTDWDNFVKKYNKYKLPNKLGDLISLYFRIS